MEPAPSRRKPRATAFSVRLYYGINGRNSMIIVIAATRPEVENHSYECTITLDEGNADCTAPVNAQ